MTMTVVLKRMTRSTLELLAQGPPELTIAETIIGGNENAGNRRSWIGQGHQAPIRVAAVTGLSRTALWTLSPIGGAACH